MRVREGLDWPTIRLFLVPSCLPNLFREHMFVQPLRKTDERPVQPDGFITRILNTRTKFLSTIQGLIRPSSFIFIPPIAKRLMKRAVRPRARTAWKNPKV